MSRYAMARDIRLKTLKKYQPLGLHPRVQVVEIQREHHKIGMHSIQCSLLWPQTSWSTSFQVMAFRLIDAEPLTELVLTY